MPKIQPMSNFRGDSVVNTMGVEVAIDCVAVKVGEGVIVGGPGVEVTVAGGVTSSTNF